MIEVNYIDIPIDVEVNYNTSPQQANVNTIDLPIDVNATNVVHTTTNEVTQLVSNPDITVVYEDSHIHIGMYNSHINVDANDFYLAIEPVNGNKLLCLSNGGVKHFDNTESNYNKAIGFSINAGTVGEIIMIKRHGKLNSFGSLIPDATYYAGTNGSITATFPSNGELFVEVGTAVNASTLDVKLNHELVTI
jgi:hypothetical protein